MLADVVVASMRILCVLALLVAAPGLIRAAEIPQLINYQGRLSTAEGGAISGVRSLTFAYYDHPTTGAVLWSETQSVTVNDGRFNVLLGSVNPITAAVFAGSEVYLGVKVETDLEMLPRQRVASVPYAMRAGEGRGAWPLARSESFGASGSGVHTCTTSSCSFVVELSTGKDFFKAEDDTYLRVQVNWTSSTANNLAATVSYQSVQVLGLSCGSFGANGNQYTYAHVFHCKVPAGLKENIRFRYSVSHNYGSPPFNLTWSAGGSLFVSEIY